MKTLILDIGDWLELENGPGHMSGIEYDLDGFFGSGLGYGKGDGTGYAAGIGSGSGFADGNGEGNGNGTGYGTVE